MKLIPTRPVTIYKTENSVVINPYMLRHPSGALCLWIEDGHDSNFTPVFRMRSTDNGRTWLKEGMNVPRVIAAYSFPDGELFEMDAYGFLDPKTDDTYHYYGSWSHPERPNDQPQRELIQARVPGRSHQTMQQMLRSGRSYPTYFWWSLMNQIHGKPECSASEVIIGGAYMTAFLEHEGRLLGMGYTYDNPETERTLCLESRDRGHTWEVIGTIRDPQKQIRYSEASLVCLKDGRLYSVLRTYGVYRHTWSSDGGKTWTAPEPLRIVDGVVPHWDNFPSCQTLADGTLVLTGGRPGKHVVFDPSGTGTQWQGHLDLHAWELETQALMGVPPELRLHGETHRGIPWWDSKDYLSLTVIGPREFLVCYDVQTYYEHWNATPYSGIRMVRVRA